MLTVKELFASPEEGSEVLLCGWLRTVRRSKTVAFLNLSDGSCLQTVQLVAEDTLPDFDRIASLGTSTAVRVRGAVILTPEAAQPFEVQVRSLTVEGDCPSDYPLQNKRHSLEYLRTIAHLRPRANTYMAAFRIRSEAAFAIHAFFHERGFVYVNTPIITGSDCEGAGEMFRVTALPPGETNLSDDFFGKSTGLTVSGQLEAEAFALAFGKTYTFGPTFRAERSNTARHAAEFWMIEPEIAFADLQDDMQLAEDMVKAVVQHLLSRCSCELEFCNRYIDKTLMERLDTLVGKPFARMAYTDAVKQLEKATVSFEYPVFWGCDLQTEHERYLTEQVTGGPLFVTDYPKEIKAFYMRLSDDRKTVAAMDLLLPQVGELIGGSQREEREDVLRERMAACGLRPDDYQWYLDLRRFGTCKHAGFGLGFERFLMAVTGIGNIRDVLPFPRTPGHAEF